MRVLVAEDETRLADLLDQLLREDGHEVTVVRDGTAALQRARSGGFDVLLLDWGLPGREGPEVVAALRQEGLATPVLLLTARGAVDDRVAGLEAGADDYLAKPFDVRELLARLKALQRRGAPSSVTALRAGDLVVDPVARTASRAGEPLALSSREFAILTLLLQRAGECVSRFTILDEVWDGATDLRSNAIDAHVKGLRAKVDKPFGRHAVQTVRGAGYRLDPAGG